MVRLHVHVAMPLAAAADLLACQGADVHWILLVLEMLLAAASQLPAMPLLLLAVLLVLLLLLVLRCPNVVLLWLFLLRYFYLVVFRLVVLRYLLRKATALGPDIQLVADSFNHGLLLVSTFD